MFLCNVRSWVNRTACVCFNKIDCWWSDLLSQCIDRDREFQAATRSKRVTMDWFCGRDRHAATVITENADDGLGFSDVVGMCRCAVSVDVMDILRTQLGVF